LRPQLANGDCGGGGTVACEDEVPPMSIIGHRGPVAVEPVGVMPLTVGSKRVREKHAVGEILPVRCRCG